MKIIFLDVDGVLNNENSYPEVISKNLIMIFAKIVHRTDAKIVVSSSWRKYKSSLRDLRMALKEFNIQVLDQTPELMSQNLFDNVLRSTEIKSWLSSNMGLNIEQFAILDDMSDANIEGHFFQTDHHLGLTHEIADEVIRFLGEKNEIV